VADVRVLVVDDQEPFRRAIAAVVAETDGFVVVASIASGEESLAAVARLRPNLVLMDVNLPGIDGIEATRRMMLDADAPVVVLLSTHDEDDFDISGCGAASYVAKAAFGPDRLADAWAAATTQPIQPEVPTGGATPPPAPVLRRRSEC
jgi:DNA-binding NarL/FixJ family response regulator